MKLLGLTPRDLAQDAWKEACHLGTEQAGMERGWWMGVRLKIWLEKNGDLVLGSGRKELLGLLREHGSLNKAAKELSMSYRAAWGKIRATEGRLGWKLVKVQGRRRHMTLTPEGEDLLDRYIAFEREATRVLGELYQRFFPQDI